MAAKVKKTPLHEWHLNNGANMADFGGYEMPLWYSSVKEEHLAVLTKAGIFDTSHMAAVLVSGDDALELLQHCFTNDMNRCVGKSRKPLYPGRCAYGAFLDEQGNVLDDTIIFQLKENSYIAVVNAGMGAETNHYLAANSGERNVELMDLTDQVGKMDIQGPMSALVMKKILADPDKVFEKMPYFSFKGHFDSASSLAADVKLIDGTPILLSRTGYTGEFGFEIFIENDHIVKLWEMIVSAGHDYGITPCGLAARDSLRAGAVLPLSHQDIGRWLFINHPWHFALPFELNGNAFTKEFIGDSQLLNGHAPEYTYAFAGNDLRKVSTSDPAEVIDSIGNSIGKVLTCATDIGIGRFKDRIYSISSPDKPEEFNPRGLCCGFVRVKKELKADDIIELKDRRRKIEVRIVDDIRPDRTARMPMSRFLDNN